MKKIMARPRFKLPAPPSRSPMAVLLSFIVLSLPPILYIVSMGLTIATTKTPDYVRQNFLDASAEEQITDLIHHQSPWYSCTFNFVQDEPESNSETCVRRDALGEKGTEACETAGDGHDPKNKVCPKITMVAELYTAAAVLLGIGCLMTFLFAVASCTTRKPKGAGGKPEDPREEEHTGGNTDTMSRFIGMFGLMVGLGGAACLIAGQILGYSVMVIESGPLDVGQRDEFTRFFPGKGLLTYTSTAYGLALGATWIGTTKCGLRH